MRLVSFQIPTSYRDVPRLGALLSSPEAVVDLQVAYLALLTHEGADAVESTRMTQAKLPPTMGHFIALGSLEAAAEALEFAAENFESFQGPGERPGAFGLGDVDIVAPLIPNSLRDFIAFEDHAKAGAARRNEELASVWYDRPIYYKGNHRSIEGPGETVPRPKFTEELDFELEVGCIVGKKGRDLDEASAAESIFGFTIMNDWSARDIQRTEMAARLGPAKSKDFATSLGPCIVTADEVGPHPSLAMTARVNGEVVCEANLGNAYWTFPKLIAFVSQDEDVWPTDLFGSGTPFGGCLLDRGGPYLTPGDVVELEVEKIGALRNAIS